MWSRDKCGQKRALRTFLSNITFFPFTTFKFHISISGAKALYLGSTLAVASSIINIRFFLRIALARHTSCLCPTLKFDPDSANSVSILPGRSSMASFSCTCGYRKKDTFLKELLLKATSLWDISALRSSGRLTYLTRTARRWGERLHISKDDSAVSEGHKGLMTDPATGHLLGTSPRDYFRKSLKKWSYFSHCDLNVIFMADSSFPNYILQWSQNST